MSNGSRIAPAPGGRIESSIVLISIAMLMFEILQAIVLSFQTIERNAFLVVSMCLLGLGGGGSIATVPGSRFHASSSRILLWSALGFAVTLVTMTFVSSWTTDLRSLIVFGVFPYLFVGIFLAFIFRSWPEAAATIAATRTMRWVTLATLILLIVVVPVRGSLFGFSPAPRKGIAFIANNPENSSEITWSRWGYLGRLDVLRPGEGIERFHLGGREARRLLDAGVDMQYAASTLAVFFAMQASFSIVLYLGTAAYLVALLFFVGRLALMAEPEQVA